MAELEYSAWWGVAKEEKIPVVSEAEEEMGEGSTGGHHCGIFIGLKGTAEALLGVARGKTQARVYP